MIHYLRILAAKLWGLFGDRGADRELDDEIKTHLRLLTERYVRQGMSEAEAARAARRQFGNMTLLKEDHREMRGIRFIETLFQDLRYGVRMLRKNPGFTFVAALTLSLGIGANTAIFSVVNGVLLRPLPYRDPQRLVMVWATKPQYLVNPINPREFVDLRDQNQTFEQISAFQPLSLNITQGGEPETLSGTSASTNLFTLLGIDAKLGRAFLAEEDQPGADRVVILSHGLWQRRFGSDPKIVGQTITLNNEPYTVVGVAPPGFQFPRKGDMPAEWLYSDAIDFYTPLALTPEQISHRKTALAVIARLKPQFSLEQAHAEATGFAERLERQYPDANRDKGMRVVGLHQHVIGRVRRALLVLQGAIGFVLLIACANVANLLLVRAAARQKEIAIRAALGAGRGRVVRQLLTESLLLAIRNVLTMDIRLPRSKYQPPQQAAFFQQLLERLRALPGAQSAGAGYPLPLSGTDEGVGLGIEGPADPGHQRVAGPRIVGGDYFNALRIQVKSGRVFTDSDGRETPPVVVINDAMAREYWPNQDPIGKRIFIPARRATKVDPLQALRGE